MFLDDFCNDPDGWGPINDDKNDLTPCSQSIILFAPVNFIFIILGIISIISMLRNAGKIKTMQLQHRLSIISSNMEATGGITICNFDLVFSFLFSLGFSYGLITAIILPQTNSKDKINYVIWSLSWFLCSWIVHTILFYMERRYVQLYGMGEAPSTLVRWFWVIQFILCLKNMESVLVANYVNNTIDIKNGQYKGWYYFELFAIIPFTILLIRAVFMKPLQSEEESGFDSKFYPSKLSMQNFGGNLQYKQLINDDSMDPSQYGASFDFSKDSRAESLIPDKDQQYQPRKYKKTSEETANLFSILSFGWLSKLFTTGYNRKKEGKALEMEDLDYLRGTDHAHESVKLFYQTWREQIRKAKEKNIKYRIKEGIEDEDDHKVDVNVIDNKAPLLARQLSDDTKMPRHEKVDKDAKYKPSVLKAVLNAFGTQFFIAGPLKLIYDCFQYAGPVVLSAYLSDATKLNENNNKDSLDEAYLYAALLFITYMCGTFILAQYFHRCFRAGMRVRAGLMAACYEKALKLTQSARSEKTAGEIMTIVTVDVRKIRDVFPYCWMLISAPFQICVAVYLLYQQIGWSVFIGIAAQTLLMAPLQTLVGINARKLQKQVQKVRDKRMEVVNEVFGAMKIIKMYAWEMSFGNKISNIRNEELSILRCYVWWYTIMILFWGWAPTLVSLTAFMAYTANGGQLTAEKAFTSIALFNLLRFPLAMLPMVTISFIDANNSLRRIREFLSANEIDPNIIQYAKIEGNKSYETKLKGGGIPPSKVGKNGNQLLSSFNDEPVEIEQKDDDEEKEGNGKHPAIKIEDATFTWDDEMNQAALININLEFKHGTTTMVIGETGSGKSALLRAILGNLTKANGKIIYGESRLDVGQHIRVAYSSQVAWIQNAKLKDNILFGNKYDEKLYNQVIESCALIDDLKILPGGDQTEIGEKGINLSGGQKQRISLARAVYSNADVYVFDDPLSAVDSHVANHIFNQCFLDLLKGKTIVLATHAVSFLKYADNIIVMDQGKIKLEGQLQDLIDAKVNLTKFIIHKNEEENKEDEDEEEEENALLGSPKSPRRQKSTESEKSSASKSKDDKKKGKDGKLVDEEERGKGDVSFAVYWLYVKAAGGICLFLMYIFFLGSYYGFNTIATFWLAFWSDKKIGSKDMTDKSEWWWLDIYTAIQMGSLLMLFMSAVMALVTRLRASKYLHESLLAKMLHAPMSFFDTTPIGRIINRFARDMYAIDQAVPSSYQSALRITIYLFSTALGVCIVTPYFAVSLIFLGPLYYYLQKYFITTSRELRRLSTLQNSPIYSNFSESIAGQDILRSFNKTNEFSTKNKDMIDKDHQAYYPSVAANRWLAIRLEFIGNCLIGAAALFCAITQPPAGLVGVALSTIMSVTQGLNWFVRQKAQLEQDIVSVERIDQYSNNETPQEKPYILKQNRPPSNWPSKGEITFNNVWMRYREGLEYVLKGLSFDVAPGEKIGVIGRTGAGKSSLFVTLLRLVEIENEVNNQSCQVIVDGIDVSQIGLQDLRSKMSVIPQDPILFTGTVRFNLDPFNPHTLKLDQFLHKQQMDGLQSELKKNEIKTVEELYKLTDAEVNEKFHGNSKQSVIELKQYLNQYDNDLTESLKLAHCYDAMKKMIIEITLKKERDEQDKKEKEEKEKQAKKDKKNRRKQKEENKTKTNGTNGEKSKGLLSDSLRENSISKFNVSQYMDNPKYTNLNPLDIMVEENGSNFSVGQRQLLCLARAIVRGSKILLLDEATSAVDPSTDQLIQETIRNVFKTNTILTIAHRIDTILDYDRILIMDKGKVLEYDKPQALLSNEKSRFSEIVQESFGVNLDDVLSKKLGNFNSNDNDNDGLAIQEETNEDDNDNTPN